MVQEIKNLADFKQLINGDKPVAVDFYAQWCGPCKIISPKFEKLAEKFANIIFAKVDVDEGTDIAEEYSIRAMPTFIFFANGEKRDEVVGANAALIEAKLNALSA
ncbi:thioredoxin [Umbelopsis sp. PMI_123]|nr:thioredoxin [Umbelopsis sp. PMI_123]